MRGGSRLIERGSIPHIGGGFVRSRCKVHHPKLYVNSQPSPIDTNTRMAMQIICRRGIHSYDTLCWSYLSSSNALLNASLLCRGRRRRALPLIFGVKHSFFSTATATAMDDNFLDGDDHNHNNNIQDDTVSSRLRHRHCKTCTCPDSEEINEQQQSASPNNLCHPYEPLIQPNTPLPPPLPKPNYSFKCRLLPSNLVSFNSPIGKERFLYSLQSNYAEAYFPLSQQFLNQIDPAFCGVTTLILVLNALAMDPNVRWRGGWRWYGDENMLLERCCLEEERVKREGITLEQYCGLARCQGVDLIMKRPMTNCDGIERVIIEEEEEEEEKEAGSQEEPMFSLEEFRRDIINAVTNPPQTDDYKDSEQQEGDTRDTTQSSSKAGGYFIVTSFARSALNQTGDGHFSPIAAYHPPTDSCLVLDVARFKYTPYWVTVKDLYDAMIPPDKATGKSRGWILMYPPRSNNKSKGGKRRTKEEYEGKRPAACVPLAGTGESICAMEKIKIDYCSVKKR